MSTVIVFRQETVSEISMVIFVLNITTEAERTDLGKWKIGSVRILLEAAAEV